MLRSSAVATLLLIGAAGTARAADYYDHHLFDYPDPFSHRLTAKCSWHPRWTLVKCLWPKDIHHQMLWHSAVLVVSGPSSPSVAITNAVEGYAAVCGSIAAGAAITAGGGFGAISAGTFAIPAAAGAAATAFEACVTHVSLAGVAGGIVKQLDLRIDTSHTYWK